MAQESLYIKRLTHQDKTLAPITISEAVLVNYQNQETTLNKVLNEKLPENLIQTPTTSGLTHTVENGIITLKHSNTLQESEQLAPVLISFDRNGHITNTKTFSPIKITIEGQQTDYDGSEEVLLNFGDDFIKDENNNISLTWKNYGDT